MRFETSQFPAKSAGAKAAAPELVAAREARFDWIALDCHTLAAAARSRGGLEELARVCAEARLPCRSVHSLRITNDAAEAAAQVSDGRLPVRLGFEFGPVSRSPTFARRGA
jgi:hypothetical protein